MDKTSLHQGLEKLSENSQTLTVFKIIQWQIIIYVFYLYFCIILFSAHLAFLALDED